MSFFTAARLTAVVSGRFGLSILTFAAAGSAIAADLSPEQMDTLRARKVIVSVSPDSGGADGRVDAAIDIAAPKSAVWVVLLDCARAPSFMPALKSCRVLSRSPAEQWDIREHRVSWTDFLPDTRSVFRSEYTKEALIRFTRVEGDLSYLEGDWRLEPINEGKGTRLFYRARIGISLPVPTFMIRSALESDVPNFLGHLRKEIESSLARRTTAGGK